MRPQQATQQNSSRSMMLGSASASSFCCRSLRSLSRAIRFRTSPPVLGRAPCQDTSRADRAPRAETPKYSGKDAG